MQPETETRTSLGQLRLVVEKCLEAFVEDSGIDSETIWNVALTAQDIPDAFYTWESVQTFWDAFTDLRAAEAKRLAEVVGS